MKKQLIKTVISLVLVGILVHLGNIEKIVATLSQANPLYYLAATITFLTTYIASGKRWQIYTKTKGYKLSLKQATGIMAISYALNTILPANSGDLTRSKVMERYTEIKTHKQILKLVIIERISDFLTLSIIIGLSAIVTSKNYIIAVITVIKNKLTPFDRETNLKNIFLSFYKWSAEAVLFLLLAQSIGLNIGIWEAALTTSAISIASALPITPAGIGVGDIASVSILGSLGIGYNAALTLTILQRSIGIVQQTLIGLIAYNYSTWRLQ